MTKTKKPTTEERLAALEARFDKINKAHIKYLKEMHKLTDDRNTALKKWADSIVEDLHRLYYNDKKLAYCIETHSHRITRY